MAKVIFLYNLNKLGQIAVFKTMAKLDSKEYFNIITGMGSSIFIFDWKQDFFQPT